MTTCSRGSWPARPQLSGRAAAVVSPSRPPTRAGLVWLHGLHVRWSGTRWSGRAWYSPRRSPAGRAAHGALAQALADEPYRRTWHRAQSITNRDHPSPMSWRPARRRARRGAVTEAIWVLERSAQLTSAPPGAGTGCSWRPSTRSGWAAPTGRPPSRQSPPVPTCSKLNLRSDGMAARNLQRRRPRRRDPGDGRLCAHRGRVGGRRGPRPRAEPAARCRAAVLVGGHRADRTGWVAEVARLLDAGTGDPGTSRRSRSPSRSCESAADTDCPRAFVPGELSDPDALWLLGMAAHAIGRHRARSVDLPAAPRAGPGAGSARAAVAGAEHAGHRPAGPATGTGRPRPRTQGNGWPG